MTIVKQEAGSNLGWRKIAFVGLSCLATLCIFGFWLLGGFRLIASMSGPEFPFEQMAPPAVPDFSKNDAWLAFPGDGGIERITIAGDTPVNERQALADLFFVHPTTIEGSEVWNAPYDVPLEAAPLFVTVLLGQISVFNGCCRLYAPHYRQATLAALKTPHAMDIAYSDVARAFRYYIDHINKGRPFVIAAHSQGTAHATRLLQEQVLGQALKERLVAAYLIGGYVPDTFKELGLPVCNHARQTGCVVSYNASQERLFSTRMIVDDKRYWWKGQLEKDGQSNAICVNPLTWDQEGQAPASANQGSLPLLRPMPVEVPKSLPDLAHNLTGASCRDGLLKVDVPWSAPPGFADRLSFLSGSYHLNDYGLFYDALRRNVIDRVRAFAER